MLSMRNVCINLQILVAAILVVVPTNGEHTGRELEQQALTPEKWMSKYWCNLAPENSSAVQPYAERRLYIEKRSWAQRIWYTIIHDCNRDQTLWRTKYIDELAEGYKVLVKDSSADERLANIRNFLSLQAAFDYSYFQFNSGDPKRDRENQVRVAGPSVNDSLCRLDLNEMVKQLDELGQLLGRMRSGSQHGAGIEARHIKLMRVLDAYGRYESGALSGHSRSMGFYEQCMNSVVEREQRAVGLSRDMEMRYCWARTSLRNRLNPFVKQRQSLPHETGDDALPVGVCLPRSCHSKNLNSEQNKRLVKQLLASQLTFPASIYLDQHPELDSIFCLPDEDASNFRMPTSGKLWIAFAVAWILVCSLATYFDIGEQRASRANDNSLVGAMQDMKEHQIKVIFRAEPERSNSSSLMRVAKCLNLSSSWTEFTSDRRELSATDPVDLDMLNPIKVLACIYCIYSHAALIRALGSDHLLESYGRVEADRSYQLMSSSNSILDIFYVISGLLTSYIACNRLARMAGPRPRHSSAPSSNCGSASTLALNLAPSRRLRAIGSFLGMWLALAANRYFRLVPLYAFFFYFRRDVFTYLGSGPLWDFGFNKNTMTGACLQASSLFPFTFGSLSTPLSKQCIMTGWTVTTDVVFCMLIAPFLLLQRKHLKLGLAAMAACVLGCTIYGLQIYTEQANTDLFEFDDLRFHGAAMVLNGLSGMYTAPVIRGASFLVGAIAGCVLFRYAKLRTASERDKDSISHTGWPRWFTGTATRLAIFYFLLHPLVGTFQMDLKQMISPYHRLYAAYIMTLDRTVWSIALSTILLRLVTDWRHGPWLSLFADQKFRSLARLNYPLLFVHWILILMQMSIDITLPIYRIWDMYTAYVSVHVLSLPLALVVHLIFESPFDKLIKRQIFNF